MVERSRFGVSERRKDPVAEEFRPPITSSELVAMPRPAAQGGSQPSKASGMHTAL